jgi:ferredoxin
MKEPVYLRNVVTLALDKTRCNGCGMCIKVCPHAVFAMLNHKADIVEIDQCMECGACARNCQMNAITVRSGVGCAAGIINGILKNSEPTCGCSEGNKACC